MKTVNRICQILAIAFGVASLVLFFTRFATVISGGNEVNLVGAQLGFGGKVTVAGTEYKMAKSSDILFCFILTAVSAILGILAFKSKKVRYAAPFVGIIDAVYMLVIALSNPYAFVDKRPLPDVTAVNYTPFVLIAAILLFAFTAAAVAYLLIDDYLEVKASNGSKLTIPKRIVRFFRDYKSEIKKIVWPGWKDIVKNTVIVLIMCLIIGALIWLIDFGLGQLLELILGA
ncbi:MAG: preprotein translocase subunit SecE [Acutalibacteraceae bacterium]|nr:preprotein translocase subunit SecE [Acutalibacteraceae bacterium]